MILADTSVWIEFLKGNYAICGSFQQRLEASQIVTLEIVFGELLQGTKNKRERSIIMEYWLHVPHLTQEGLWIQSGISTQHRNYLSNGVGLIDVSLIVAAELHQSQIWTLDKKLLKVLPKQLVFSPLGRD